MTEPLAAFIEDAYQDTLSLMVDLRDFLETYQGRAANDGDIQGRTHVIAEVSAITRLTTDVMAWLLLRKAVASGEMSEEEAREKGRELLAPLVEEVDADAAARHLPIQIRSYVDRSRRLYAQIQRLRGLAERQDG